MNDIRGTNRFCSTFQTIKRIKLLFPNENVSFELKARERAEKNWVGEIRLHEIDFFVFHSNPTISQSRIRDIRIRDS